MLPDNNIETKKPKAVALISGGLDSLLAAKVVMEQGVHVEGINFFTGFCVEGHTHAIRNKQRNRPKRNNALWVAEQLGIKLHILDIIEEYKNIVINPRHGYGANLNPCLDCKTFMVSKAREWMEENNFDFVITGEVVGQRPKSQRRHNFPMVERESGIGDRLLRPLCAKRNPETLPERQGWVDREKLHSFQGRSRKPQIALAEKYGFADYAQPAGGCCFLTDQSYSVKLEDLWNSRGEKEYELDDIMLLKVGRHLRPEPHFKIIIARDEGESNYLRGYRKRFTHLYATSYEGAFALIDGQAGAHDLKLAASVTARFGHGRNADQVEVKAVTTDGVEQTFQVTPMKAETIPKHWYLSEDGKRVTHAI